MRQKTKIQLDPFKQGSQENFARRISRRELTRIDPSTSKGTILVLHRFSELVPSSRAQSSSSNRTSSRGSSSPKTSVPSGSSRPTRSTSTSRCSSEEARPSSSGASSRSSRKRLLRHGGIENVYVLERGGMSSLRLLLSEEKEESSGEES